MKDLLLIFSKNPEYGKVKTRLAVTIGKEQTLFIYQKLIEHTIAVTKELSIDKTVFYSEWIDKKDNWEDEFYKKKIQSGTDLGERMKNAFKSSFTEGYDKVVIIGTDCYELETQYILSAFSRLDNTDIVLGPAIDGGYYLLGMKKFNPALFENIDWSTDKVFNQTIVVCRKLNLSVSLLPELNDIDNEEDLKNYASLLFMKKDVS